ncbi:class I SAM-dependent methyltransferase [Desulfatiglans anilini]|uniref:class I SAM-dependent methyltransferase n=1 Tax=Desulfatiglans anilini TaxID=90728 RepID=UPI0004809ABC|nr:class I SAM-dependent methyltransferase [Desulfatiglans anilini]
MYKTLHEFTQRPAPHSRFTAKELWTRPHLARQMLQFHLDQSTELASRPLTAIDSIIEWLDRKISLEGKNLCDLGCGPGLYATRFAERGANVTGVDFSCHTLDYAVAEATRTGKLIRYLHADYLADSLPTGFDVVTLIYYDYCALSSDHRKSLLAKIHDMLKPGGKVVLDVVGMGSFAAKHEGTIVESNLMGGFWAEGDYVGIQRTILYPDEALSLDRILIIEPTESWQIFNWFQYYTPERLSEELGEAGFKIDTLMGSLAGVPLTDDSEFMGVIATK